MKEGGRWTDVVFLIWVLGLGQITERGVTMSRKARALSIMLIKNRRRGACFLPGSGSFLLFRLRLRGKERGGVLLRDEGLKGNATLAGKDRVCLGRKVKG